MTATVTDNASVQVDSTATRNTCTRCETYDRPTNKRWDVELHCSTCHGSDHLACVECDACLPTGHRYDRLYCSSTCRANGSKARARQRLERQVWEAEHPDEAAAEAAELEAQVAQLNRLEGLIGRVVGPRNPNLQTWQRARDRADNCAKCNNAFGASDVIYRRLLGAWGDSGSIVAPVCADCRCDSWSHREWYCDRCRRQGRTWDWTLRTHLPRWYCPAAGPEHAGPYCGGCHPAAWRDPTPCEGCARLVSNHETVRRGMRNGAVRDQFEEEIAWVPNGSHWDQITVDQMVRVFCSETCRRRVFMVEGKVKRLTARDDTPRRCDGCKELFAGRRSDARYCSPSCRQRAYRQQKADR